MRKELKMTHKSDHRPVMPAEVNEWLNIEQGSWYVDCTLGGGGHTKSLLDSGARVIAYDWDQEAITAATERFAEEIRTNRLVLIHESFASLSLLRNFSLLREAVIRGCLFDFGTSTDQLMSENRGFSFNGDGPLDMRMDVRRGVTAADMLNFLSEKELTQILQDAGEKQARAIAKAIKKNRIATTKQLADTVARVKRSEHSDLHPATKVFMALRIAVNTELDEIREALPQALEMIAANARIICLTFHDGEDSIVKHQFQSWQQDGLGQVLTKKPLTPSSTEIFHNPRSRSAKFRVFVKN